ncbi:hypothetical protein GCM10023156_67980 [Novipirellula rosea]|uniref:Uncharacterized protein n=1 Tax=Novipirellula rosea TaxID=1031540 RepID=A0ABP8NUE7_9BACT
MPIISNPANGTTHSKSSPYSHPTRLALTMLPGPKTTAATTIAGPTRVNQLSQFFGGDAEIESSLATAVFVSL